jgi:hypothetical protein
MSANIWHYLNISLVHEFTPWILSGELHSIYVMILLHDICVLFICNVYVLCNREQKRRTSSVLSKPASPRLWKNVTTAALEKVELQKLFGAFSISEKLFGAFRREYWDRDTYEVAFLFNQHALVTVLSYLLIQWHAEILFNHLLWVIRQYISSLCDFVSVSERNLCTAIHWVHHHLKSSGGC